MADLEAYCFWFHLLDEIVLQEMKLDECSNCPQADFLAYDRAIMKHGARIPLISLVRGVPNHYELVPSQLNPNTYKLMARMHVLWRQLEFGDLSPEEFYHVYRPASQKTNTGYIFMRPWQKNLMVMGILSSSCGKWMDKNFWLGGNFDPFNYGAGQVEIP